MGKGTKKIRRKFKKIIWKSYKDDKSFENQAKKNIDKAQMEPATWRNRILRFVRGN